jgi:membrane protein implicated in regulation of membrane protease activity
MDIIDYFLNHHDKLFYLIAAVSFIVELSVLGLSGPLLFFAIASAITGILISLGIMSGWEYEILTLGLLTGVSALVLWKPLKTFQNATEQHDTSSDMIGRKVTVSKTVTHSEGSIRFSGVDWPSRLADESSEDTINESELCVIVAVDGTIMLVDSIK